MHVRLTTLSDAKALIEDDGFPVDDLLFSWADRKLKYFAVQTGGWFQDDVVLIAASMAAPIDADGQVRMLVTKSELDLLPRSSAKDASAWPYLPPIVIGPFGTTQSPPLLLAQLSSLAGEESAEENETAQVGALDRASDWIGKEVFRASGTLGTLGDVLIDTADNALSHLVIDIEGKKRVFPVRHLRHAAQQGTHLVIDATDGEIASAPLLDEIIPDDGSGGSLFARILP